MNYYNDLKHTKYTLVDIDQHTKQKPQEIHLSFHNSNSKA